MPRRDGTGPMGQGSMTGRGMGVCANSTAAYPRFGFGYGRGLGRGLGRVGGYGAGLRNLSNQNLKDEKELLQKRIEEINSQLS